MKCDGKHQIHGHRSDNNKLIVQRILIRNVQLECKLKFLLKVIPTQERQNVLINFIRTTSSSLTFVTLIRLVM